MECLEHIKEFLDKLLDDMFRMFETIIEQNTEQPNEEIKKLIEETGEKIKDYLQNIYPTCPDIFPYIDNRLEEYFDLKQF